MWAGVEICFVLHSHADSVELRVKYREELMTSSYLKLSSAEAALNTCKDNLLNKQVTLSHPHF